MGEPWVSWYHHNISHLRRRFIMNLCFIKQIKWNYQRTNTLNSVWSKVWGLRVEGLGFRASFGNRRARPRNVGSMKWYFLKQKKVEIRNRVNLENSWTFSGHIFFEKNIRFPSLDLYHNKPDWCSCDMVAMWLLDRLGHKWLNIDQPLMMCFLAKFEIYTRNSGSIYSMWHCNGAIRAAISDEKA